MQVVAISMSYASWLRKNKKEDMNVSVVIKKRHQLKHLLGVFTLLRLLETFVRRGLRTSQ